MRLANSSWSTSEMYRNPFTDAEIDRRLAAGRAGLSRRELEAGITASPENIFYLTGLDHWGYFAPHLLIVPLEGRPVLVTRAMERVTIENQVRSAELSGHSDSETAADVAGRVLSERKLSDRPIGLEMWTSGMSHGLATTLVGRLAASWADISG